MSLALLALCPGRSQHNASNVSGQEITRRVNLHNIWQAAYTAGAVLPRPVSTTQYWHRSLNPKKLISVGFSRLQVRLNSPARK